MGYKKCLDKESGCFEMKSLRNLVGVSRMDWVRNLEVPRIAVIERELASRADHRVLRGKNGCVPYGQKGVDGGSKRR